MHSEVRLLLSSRPTDLYLTYRQGRIQEFLRGGGVTHHVNPRAKETKLELGGLRALPQKKNEILSAKYAFSCQLETK